MPVPESIPFPPHWYALVGHVVAKPSGVVAQAAPVFSDVPAEEFIRVLDTHTREISFSSREAVEEYLTNLGFVNAGVEADPELWRSDPPTLVWRGFYDYIRVIEMRVLN